MRRTTRRRFTPEEKIRIVLKRIRRESTIKAVNAWLTLLKFVGMAMFFTGIALALLTIVKVLRFPALRLVEVADQRS